MSYNTEYLLDRIYNLISEQKNITDSTKLIMTKPEVVCENKKTYVKNFNKICYKLNREVSDIKKFFEEELLKKSSINSEGSLIIGGIFRQKQIQSILLSYIKQCVICKECNSTNTILFKEERVLYLECKRCKSKKAQ